MTPDIRDVRVNYLTKSNRLYPSHRPLDCVSRVAIMVEFTAVADEDKLHVRLLRPMGVGEVKSETE